MITGLSFDQKKKMPVHWRQNGMILGHLAIKASPLNVITQQSYTIRVQDFWVASSGFVNKPTSDYFSL